jgi:hypothetical protein
VNDLKAVVWIHAGFIYNKLKYLVFFNEQPIIFLGYNNHTFIFVKGAEIFFLKEWSFLSSRDFDKTRGGGLIQVWGRIDSLPH